MRKRAGLTRIDLVVALACLAFMLANVRVYSSAGRGHAKRQVCMANLKTLTAAWQIYANDHHERIPCADIYYSRQVENRGPSGWTENDMEMHGPGWYEWPHNYIEDTPNPNPTCDWASSVYPNPPYDKDHHKHGIRDGSLWKYIKDYKVYKCPNGDKGQFVTYAIVHSMNAWPSFSPLSMEIYYINQIIRPAERMVFIDEGYASTGAFAVIYGSQYISNPKRFWDPAPRQHNNGTTVSFADGHTEYWKWLDQRTIMNTCWTSTMCRDWGNNDTYDLGDTPNCDLIRLHKAIWGKLAPVLEPYAENCD